DRIGRLRESRDPPLPNPLAVRPVQRTYCRHSHRLTCDRQAGRAVAAACAFGHAADSSGSGISSPHHVVLTGRVTIRRSCVNQQHRNDLVWTSSSTTDSLAWGGLERTCESAPGTCACACPT